MDLTTISVYNKYSDYYFTKYDTANSGISKYFSIAFNNERKILDIGCGLGRDLNLLIELGYDAYGIDPSEKLLNYAINKFPNLIGRVKLDNLPVVADVPDKFDGILISAVLMHIPQIELFDSIFTIKNLLRENGSVLISIPKEYPGIEANSSRDAAGRLFNRLMDNQLILLFERLGFKLIEKWQDEVNQEETSIIWDSLYFRLRSDNFSRPLDSIDAILNKDQKVATYKLALFRALAEIATHNQKAAHWLPDGTVKLHVDNIVEKWIEYYWTIFNSNDFIPQIQKESIHYSRPVAFRESLTNLIKQYKNSGGLEGFIIDRSRFKLQINSLEDYAKAHRIIRKTLISGPIKHSGGYNSPNKLFNYDMKGFIIIPDLIWKELILLGPWIVDSTILRWAELTSKFSQGLFKPSQIIDLLLVPDNTRRIDDARHIYCQQADLKCVWTSQRIKDFDIDHIIPFSLWKNNDLWNLVPSKPSINRSKSDKLVSYSFLVFSKDNIIYSWKKLYSAEPTRFLNEAKLLTGNYIDKKNWENLLFSGLKEVIEYTALQRGIERWEPGFYKSSN